MKFKKMLRAQLILAGLGSALLLAHSVKAQEIENTEFSDGPNLVALQESAPEMTPPAANSGPANSDWVPPVAAVDPSGLTQRASLNLAFPADDWVGPAILFCIALVALCALLEAKRANRALRSNPHQCPTPDDV